MTLSFNLYWSFRSPYCYLAADRLAALTRDYDVSCRLLAVYPHVVRAPEAFAQRSPLWFSYFKQDIVRTADFLGLPIAWPRPDPVAVDPATGAALAAQPNIPRLTRLGAAAEEAGRGLAFVVEVSRAMWSPDTPDWTAPGVLAAAAAKAGLDFAALDAKVAADPDRYEAIIQENQRAEAELGHWGVPVMDFRGEPFFGQDRIDQLIWRMGQAGLARRTGAAA